MTSRKDEETLRGWGEALGCKVTLRREVEASQESETLAALKDRCARAEAELERLLGPMGPLARIAMVHPECAAPGCCEPASHDWAGCVYCHVRNTLRGTRHDA
jgi:hypothetical protein